MIDWELAEKMNGNKDNPYIIVKTKDRYGKPVKISYHGYLFGLMGAIKAKKDIDRHALVLVCAPPGDGKSTFVEGLAGLDNLFMNNTLSLDDIAWSMDNLIMKMDSKDNINRTIWADEFIQAGGSRGMAITNVGNKLKIGFVTKRLKKNTYFLVLDNVKEFPEKVVEMADALIFVRSFGFLRGYFDCYVNKTNIEFLYKAFKEYKKTWNSPEVKRIRPDCKGKFDDWRGIFLDPEEFDERKIEQTKQMEEEANSGSIILTEKMIKALNLKMENPQMTQNEIGQRVGVHFRTVGDWFKKMKSMGVM